MNNSYNNNYDFFCISTNEITQSCKNTQKYRSKCVWVCECDLENNNGKMSAVTQYVFTVNVEQNSSMVD